MVPVTTHPTSDPNPIGHHSSPHGSSHNSYSYNGHHHTEHEAQELGDTYLGDVHFGDTYLGDVGDTYLGDTYLGDTYLGDVHFGGAYDHKGRSRPPRHEIRRYNGYLNIHDPYESRARQPQSISQSISQIISPTASVRLRNHHYDPSATGQDADDYLGDEFCTSLRIMQTACAKEYEVPYDLLQP